MEYYLLCLSIMFDNVLWRGNKGSRFPQMEVVGEPQNLVILHSVNDEEGKAREINNQINLKQTAVVSRYSESRVVELADVSEKRIAFILGVKPFEKDPKCWVTKLYRNYGSNIPADMASHLRQDQILTSTSMMLLWK